MTSNTTHLVKWNMEIIRRWTPPYFLDNERVKEPFPPFDVTVNVTFDDNAAALAFESRVREILEEMT